MTESKDNIRINSFSSVILQIAVIIQGLLLPRLNLAAFGSDVNGLTSSISQFLGFFSVLEGGISGVILAALYGPVVKKDNERISEIVSAANKFLKKLAIGFLAYSVVLSIVYPFTNNIFSWGYTASLVLIYSITTFMQYYYAIIPQLIVRADNKVYIFNLVQLLFIIINIISTIICLKVYPEIHVVKLLSAVFYLVEPIILNAYVQKHFVINKKANADESILKNRWNGFGINIANIITTNTDMAVLTIFATLKDVSIYSVYYGIVSALKNFIMSYGYGYQSLIGQKIAQKDKDGLDKYFKQYEFSIFNLSGIAYSCCMCLIVPFVMIYTSGVNDANYNQKLFAILICLALYILCIREPYIQATYTAGLFKETQLYAYIEAILNIVISIILVKRIGLVGVAIGTVISAFYRYLATVFYLKDHVLNYPVIKSIQNLFIYLIPPSITTVLGLKVMTMNLSLYQWTIAAILILVVSVAIHYIFDFIFFKEQLLILKNKSN